MKTQKKKGLQKYQDPGYAKSPYNDPFASIFSNAIGSGFNVFGNTNPFLNIQDSILGQPLATSVNNQGQFLGSLPMFQQLNKPLGTWTNESKGIEKSIYDEDIKKYGANDIAGAAQAWAKETGFSGNPGDMLQAYTKSVQGRAGQQYDSTVSAQKQWGEFGKPLAANMFALDELNTLSEKSYNQGLKLDAQDLTKGTKGQEFRGFFAKDGMRVGSRSIDELHRSMGADTGLPHAGLGGFLKSVGKGIVNSVHDLGVGIADGFGNSTGLYDINNDKYKTGLGQNVAGFANTMSATTGKLGRAIASAAVPGVGGAAAGALSSLGGATNPQGVAQTQPQHIPQQQNQQMDWLKMLSANPQIISQFMGFLQGPQYGKGVGGYENGGQINQLQQMLGYKDNSPFKGMPFQTINSNSITMDGVSQPLLAIADNGEVKMLPPNSGLHKFKGAKSVTEVPLGSFEEGGIPDRYKEMGFSKVNTPKRTPGADKSHAVVIKDDGDYRLIRFGQQGVSGSPAKEGESESDKNRRESFKARHAENIAKGKTSAAYWANKVKWYDGGQITSPINLSKNINPFRLSPINSFGLGGFIRDGVPSRPKSEVGFSRQPISGATTKGPMGPKATDIPSYNGGVRSLMDMPENEYISTENLIPIQTEKGEMIVMPTGDLVKVMATKRHHQMDEDEVTDVAPEGAYILSSFGKVRINKDEAEQVITETGVKPYRIGGTQDSPTEKNLGSMMTKKSMAPADIAKRVDRFFPVNSTSNPFELAANNENKTHRVPYLEGLIQLSELDKLRKGIDSGMESQQQENEDEMTEAFKNGGSTWGGVPMREMFLPKAQTGLELLLIPALSGLLQSGIGALGANSQKKDAQRAYADVLGIANKSAADQKQNIGMGSLAGILGTLNQDPTVQAVYNDPTFLRQMRTQTPSSTLEAISNRAYANMPNYMQNAPTWQAGLGAQQAAYAAALKGANDSRLAIGEQDRAAYNNWLGLMQNNLDSNNVNRVGANNATTLNRNTQINAVGDKTQGMFDSFASIEANRANTASAARLGQSAVNQQAIRAYTQAGQSAVGSAGAAAYDYFNRPNTTPQNPYTGQATTGNPIGYNPYNTPTSTATGSTTPAQGDCARQCRDIFTGKWSCC